MLGYAVVDLVPAISRRKTDSLQPGEEPKTEHTLQPGEECQPQRGLEGEDGWVFDQTPEMGVICAPCKDDPKVQRCCVDPLRLVVTALAIAACRLRFVVEREEVAADGTRFLKLADGRGMFWRKNVSL
eukprot:Skav223050  [mRNA]  locus=scaffold1069:262650:268566:- [translate_table: standard]